MSDEKIKIKTFPREVSDINPELKDELIRICCKEGISKEKTECVISAMLSKILVNGRVPKLEEIIKTICIIDDIEVENSAVETIQRKLTEMVLLDLKEESYTKRLKLMKYIYKRD